MRDVHATDRGTHNVLHVVDVQAIPRGALSIDVYINIASTGDPFGVHGRGARHIREYPLQVFANALNHGEVGSRHLDAHRRFDAGGEHVDAGFDRHHPSVGEPGILHDTIKLGPQVFGGHPFPPFVMRFQLNDSLNHGEGSGVRRGFGATDFSEHTFHFRDRANHLVGLLQNLARLIDRHTGIGCGHVHQVAFVQRRHELRTELRRRPQSHDQDQHSCYQCRFWKPYDAVNDRLVDGNQRPVDGILMLRRYLAANEIPHEYRHQGDRQNG